MAKPGDEFVDGNGGRILFRVTSSTSGGELLEIEAFYRPHSAQPPTHFHPHQEEHFEVKSGLIRVDIGGEQNAYGAGEEFVVPAMAPHSMYNDSDETGQVIWQTRPAQSTEVFFETIWGLAQDGKMGKGNGPGLLQTIVIGREYREMIRFTSPPDLIQRLLFAIVAPIGVLLGYKASFPEYSDIEN
jgi:quercetin dioxygenase-like cupin family protein